MWRNTKTNELISDLEMKKILKDYKYHLSDFGRKLTYNGETWVYDGDGEDVLYY